MIFLYVSALLCTLQHIFIHAMQLSGVNSENWQFGELTIRRIDNSENWQFGELTIRRIDNSENWHRWVASRVWQYAAACTKVHWRTRRSFSAPSLTSICICLISCTESETYAHVGLRDGGPVFRAPFCRFSIQRFMCIPPAPSIRSINTLNCNHNRNQMPTDI